jgi:hypothetical protein
MPFEPSGFLGSRTAPIASDSALATNHTSRVTDLLGFCQQTLAMRLFGLTVAGQVVLHLAQSKRQTKIPKVKRVKELRSPSEPPQTSTTAQKKTPPPPGAAPFNPATPPASLPRSGLVPHSIGAIWRLSPPNAATEKPYLIPRGLGYYYGMTRLDAQAAWSRTIRTAIMVKIHILCRI